mgnify:CR=1 FL=1
MAIRDRRLHAAAPCESGSRRDGGPFQPRSPLCQQVVLVTKQAWTLRAEETQFNKFDKIVAYRRHVQSIRLRVCRNNPRPVQRSRSEYTVPPDQSSCRRTHVVHPARRAKKCAVTDAVERHVENRGRQLNNAVGNPTLLQNKLARQVVRVNKNQVVAAW